MLFASSFFAILPNIQNRFVVWQLPHPYLPKYILYLIAIVLVFLAFLNTALVMRIFQVNSFFIVMANTF